MLFGSKKVIGLDIGTAYIKLSELDVSKGGAVLRNFQVVPTPTATLSAGDILDTMSVTEAVAAGVANLKTKRKHIAASIWGSGVIVKKINVPKMNQDLLTEQIKFEAEQYLPFDLSEVSLDFDVLKNVTSNESDTMEVLLVAAKKDMIMNYAEVVETSGLETSIIDIAGISLANCFEFNYGELPGQVVGLLNFGSSATNFVVVESGDVTFCRDIPVGGSMFSSDIQNQLGISIDEAEALKLALSSNQESSEEAKAVIDSSIETTCEEIQRSVEFYDSSSEGRSINKFYITGGSSALPNLLTKLQESLGIDVDFLDPFIRIQPLIKDSDMEYIEQIRHYSAIALGLGLRKVGDS